MTGLGEIVMILDLHRQGAGVSAIARRTGLDRKRGHRTICSKLHAKRPGPGTQQERRVVAESR